MAGMGLDRRGQGIAALVLCALLAWLAPAHSREQIVMTMMFREGEAPEGQLARRIYREAFDRMGLTLVTIYLPPKRGAIEVETGHVDGELGRASDYGLSHPNLIRVEEAAMTLTVAAYAASPTIKLTGWDSFRDTNYRVEYRFGMQIPPSRLRGVRHELVSSAPTSLSGLKKLGIDRADVYIDFEDNVETLLRANDFPGRERIAKVCILERAPIHAYLNRQREALEPKLSAVLRQMKREGLISKYQREIDAEFSAPKR
jgi:polar amino acid transport system substrate-binding protein